MLTAEAQVFCGCSIQDKEYTYIQLYTHYINALL
jgi:hypothetical protein